MKHLQLTLRDLFWLVLVCAIAAMWWRAELRARNESEAVDVLAKEMEKQLQAIADAEGQAGDGTTYAGYKVEVVRDR